MPHHTLLWCVLCLMTANVTACSNPGQRQARLSGVVAIVNQGERIEEFLKSPGLSYMQAQVRIDEGLADDVIFAIDQEFIEGVNAPKHISGGDWMAFVGLQRGGTVWVAEGNDSTMGGTPSKERKWKLYDLGAKLVPGVWYRIKAIADFKTRHHKSFSIKGPGIDKTIDLSSHKLDYPNHMPFDGRAMSYYVCAMRGRNMMKEEGVPLVYFDDAEGGIINGDGSSSRVFSSDFESNHQVLKQPLTLPLIKLSNYKENQWYLERDEAIFRIEQSENAFSGSWVGVADVNLSEP